MALDIKINSDYKITSDSRNIIIERRFIVDPTKGPNWKEGDDTKIRDDWREVANFRRLEPAIRYLAEQQTRDSDVNTLAELLHEIRRFHREISDLLS